MKQTVSMLDVDAICCEWTEYDSAQEAAQEYGWNVPERDDEEDEDDFVDRCEEEAAEWLEYRTSVFLKTRNSVVILSF